MKAPSKKLQIALLSITGGVLLATLVTFAVLFVSYNRGEDTNNEDDMLARAQAASRAGNHPVAAGAYRRLIALNPFETKYRVEYAHALMRLRDFGELVSVTNKLGSDFVLTADERTVETALERGVAESLSGSNVQAVATFASVSNLNYYAVTPYLVQAQMKAGRMDLALATARTYVGRFPNGFLILQAAELSALAQRRDLLEEIREAALSLQGRRGIALAHYCDALLAWLKGDVQTLTEAIAVLNGEVKTPLSHFLALECAASGDNAVAVERALDELSQDEKPDSRLMTMARAVVKRFLAEHFPEKITLEHIERLTNAIYDRSRPDVDVLRLSLLAKSSRGVLLDSELKEALRLFPNDRGLAIIEKRQRRTN